MKVHELVKKLEAMSPDATIVIADPDTSLQLNVRRLRDEEVRKSRLGSWESSGVLFVEMWDVERRLDGPLLGVVLGMP